MTRAREMTQRLRVLAWKLRNGDAYDRISLATFLERTALFVESGGSGLRPLTPTQTSQMAYLKAYISEYGYAPSFEDIAQHFGYRSLATVHEALEKLEYSGYIQRTYNVARGIVLINPDIPSIDPKRAETEISV